MIIYLADKRGFRNDVFSNRIDEKIHGALKARRGISVGPSELESWKNSLTFMDRVLDDDGIPDDAGVAIEYGLPNSDRRIDFILTGNSEKRQKTAIIVELKQWSDVEVTTKDAIVRTVLGGSKRAVPHPSYQAWCYSALIEDYNEAVQKEAIRLQPCCYLHNCENSAAIRHRHYQAHTARAPAFLKDDALRLQQFLKQHVRHGDNGQLIYEISAGKIRPSKSLADHLLSLLKGNKEFLLIDDQKLVYETALDLAEKAANGKKQTLIVQGGPGTGKSVVAINLLVELTARQKVAAYVTKNSAPRAVYERKLSASFTKNRISNLFKNSGAFIETEPNIFDVLVVDEAHRLNRKSGMFKNKGENQIKELIAASKLSVFFVDGAQVVTMHDIGDVENIRAWANRSESALTELTLESQFRCSGSNGFLAWIDNLLGIAETANSTLDGILHEVKVCDSANQLRDLIRARNKPNNKARMVAGYCWDWKSKKDPASPDIVLPDENFSAQWNLESDGSLWILQPNSVEQVGCIHTCQGLEVEYIGVIFGPDLVIRDGKWVEYPKRRSRMDSSIKGLEKLRLEDLDAWQRKSREIIRNTYRTLLTRGQKGCFIYSVDPETNAFLKAAASFRMPGETAAPVTPEKLENIYSFPVFSGDEAIAAGNCVPCFTTLYAAAGSFSSAQQSDEIRNDLVWAQLPDPFTAKPGYFVLKVIGESMNKKIPNGSWCLFRAAPQGSRQGKIVLVGHRAIQEPDGESGYTVKLYRSEKQQTEDGWEHTKITLSPNSTDPKYSDIVLYANSDDEFAVYGEFVAALGL